MKETAKLFMKSILPLLIMVLCTSQSQLSAQNPMELTIEVDYQQARKLNKGVYGVNNELTGVPYVVDEEGYIESINDLGLQSYRYPAGTYSNMIDLKSGEARGWDNMNPKNIERLEAVKRLYDARGFMMDYRHLVNMMAKTETTVAFIINISSSSFEDNMEAISDMKNRGAQLTHFEFGNELYYDSYKTAIESPEKYVEIAQKYMHAIRKLYPSAKFSASLQSIFYSNESFLDEAISGKDRLSEWYRAMQKNQSLFDALSVHLYSDVGMNNKTNENDFLTYEEAYSHAISHSDALFDRTMLRLQRDFPNNEFWITEYHVGGWAGPVREYRLRHTYIGALFCSNFLLKLFSAPAVTLSSWHCYQQWLAPQRDGDKLTMEPKGPNYHLFKVFKEPVVNSNQYISIEINGCGQYKGVGKHKGMFNKVDGAIFYNDITEEGYLVVMNKLNSTYQLNRAALEGAVEGKILKVEQTLPDQSMELQEAISNQTASITQQIVEPVDGSYMVKPYSVNIYKFKKSK